MNPKFLLCLALALGSGWFGAFPAKASPVVPVLAAPAMQECREATVKDLGLWDDALRFEDLDFILLRKKDALFAYSPVSGSLRKIRSAPDLDNSHLVDTLAWGKQQSPIANIIVLPGMVDGLTWGKHQWVFYQGGPLLPSAMDLANGNVVTFDIPGVSTNGDEGPAIHAVINAASGPGTIVAITGDGATGWPRDGNRPLFYWMDLESGAVKKFPTGWDLNYFSADQKRAVFETISTNAMMYRPWVTVDTALVEMVSNTARFWSAEK